jgi:WD40 repeat protein
VKLWDTATGQELRTLTEQDEPISSVAFSPDGRQLAVGSLNGIVQLWDPTNGQVLQVIKAEGVNCLAFSPDGKRLATGGGITVRLWDLTTGPEYLVINSRAPSFAFSPDSRRIAGASADVNSPQLWDAITGQGLLTFTSNGAGLNAFAFSPNGKLLATGAVDETIKLWNAGTGQELLTIKRQAGSVNYVLINPDSRVLFFPDSQRLALGNGNGDVTLLEASTGKLMARFKGLTTPISTLALSLDGRRLAAGSLGGEAKIWDVVTGQELGRFSGLAARRINIIGLAFSPDGKRLALCSAEFIIRLFDPDTFQQVTTLKGHGSLVTSIAFSPDGKRLASSSRDGTVRLWDLATGQELLTLKVTTNQNGVLRVAFSPDGKRLAASVAGGGRGVGDPRTLRVWSAASDGDAPVRRDR